MSAPKRARKPVKPSKQARLNDVAFQLAHDRATADDRSLANVVNRAVIYYCTTVPLGRDSILLAGKAPQTWQVNEAPPAQPGAGGVSGEA